MLRVTLTTQSPNQGQTNIRVRNCKCNKLHYQKTKIQGRVVNIMFDFKSLSMHYIRLTYLIPCILKNNGNGHPQKSGCSLSFFDLVRYSEQSTRQSGTLHRKRCFGRIHKLSSGHFISSISGTKFGFDSSESIVIITIFY